MNTQRVFMDREQMRPVERDRCRWVGYHFRKGVTSPSRNMTIVGGEDAKSGMHGKLIAGIPGTDPMPRCYDNDHELGFDDFVRWVRFTDPKGGRDILGIDFSLACRSTAGVATTVVAAAEVVRTLASGGLSADIEVALLNSRMCEEPGVESMRRSAGLLAVFDWLVRAEDIFGPEGTYCPRCGLATITHDAKFCCRCGANPDIVRTNNKKKGG